MERTRKTQKNFFYSKTAHTIFFKLCYDLVNFFSFNTAVTACLGKRWFLSYEFFYFLFFFNFLFCILCAEIFIIQQPPLQTSQSRAAALALVVNDNRKVCETVSHRLFFLSSGRGVSSPETPSGSHCASLSLLTSVTDSHRSQE